MTDWQPIETAPRDGTAIWLLVDGSPYLGYGEPADWLNQRDRWYVKAGFRRRGANTPPHVPDDIFGTWGYDLEPTRWMPLPEAPDVETNTKSEQSAAQEA